MCNSMEDDEDELDQIKKALGLYVDLSDLMPPDTHVQYFGEGTKQVMTLKTVDKLVKVQITLPDKVFEWFVDILDNNGQTITSTWVDHYGDNEENLKTEMRTEIESFIKIVATKKTRVVNRQNQTKTFQYLDNETWVDFDIFK